MNYKKGILTFLFFTLIISFSIFSKTTEDKTKTPTDTQIKLIKSFVSLAYILKDSVEWNSSEYYVFTSGQLRSKQVNEDLNVGIKNGRLSRVSQKSSTLYAENINGNYFFKNLKGIINMNLSATFPDIDDIVHNIKITKSEKDKENLIVILDKEDFLLDKNFQRKILIGPLAVGFDKYYI